MNDNIDEVNRRKAAISSEERAVADLFARFVQIIERLRRECPWDREQTHDSVKHLLIEEAYETVEAIDDNNPEQLKRELGDLLLHVIFHSVIGEEQKKFRLDEVITLEMEKLIRRHPHVFGTTEVSGTQEVLSNWEKIKMTEGGRKSVIDGIPRQLPALLRAYRIQEKVSGVGFDFPDSSSAWEKVVEEIEEFGIVSRKASDPERLEDEFGDVLFALVNYARFVDVNPENALRRTIDKFSARFRHVEKRLEDRDLLLEDATLEQMDEIWEEAKSGEREAGKPEQP